MKNRIIGRKDSILSSGLREARELLGIKFVKDTLILQAGTIITTLIGIPFGIILARWLHPEGLGLYHLSFAVLGLIGILGSLGVFDAGINRLATAYAKRDNEEVRDILSFVVKVVLIITPVVFIVGMFIAPYISKTMYQNVEIGVYVRVLLLGMPIGIFFGLSNIVFQSTRNMKTLVISENLRDLITSAIAVTAVLLGLGVMGAISGNVIGTAIASFIAFALYRRLRSSNLQIFPSFREALFNKIKVAKFKEYSKFSSLIAIDKKIGRLNLLLPTIFLGMLYAPQEIGYFAIALSVMSVPKLFTAQVSRNLAAKLPEAYASGDITELRKVFFKVTKYSCIIVFAATGALLLVTPYLIRLFYGVEYTPSINVAYVLAISSIISGLSGLGPLYRTLNKVHVPIYIMAVTLPIASFIGWIAIREMGAMGAGIFVVCLSGMSAIPRLLLAIKFLQGNRVNR